MRRRYLALVLAAAATALTAVAAPAVGDPLDVPPPGANNWSCKPTAEHPDPVVLVNGTFENMAKNWSTLAPKLADAGYCVFALNYGDNATAPVADSARELAPFLDKVLSATGAQKVDIVGHSQGGMLPRYNIKYLNAAGKVDDLVGIVPSNHGTDNPGAFVTGATLCPACADQQTGSPFLTDLNAGGDTLPGPDYTVITTRNDEVVTPYTSAFLEGPEQQVTNVTLQDQCPLDVFEHDQTPNDPVVAQWVIHALGRQGPADPGYKPKCLL
ncbi:alpha/beta fold hydrolase [Streptomyces sp. NPDC004647]|uniref:alpha/beta fold hydrolase n=1 Tax=Streptomyces sp. NPDC004647 TaxID=3154671 RepID=UPI00339DCCDE